MPTLVIFNPVAGRGRALRIRTTVLAELRRHLGQLRVVETTATGDAAAAAREVAGQASRVVVIGGDGTLREAVTALAGTPTRLALVPAGSGNDLAHTMGLSVDPVLAARTAATGQAVPLDVIRVTVDDAGGRLETISANVCGLGFDARVSQAACDIPVLRGSLLYAAAIVRALPRLQPIPLRLTCGDRTWDARVLLVAVANGPAFGGGLRIAPEARTDDGLLDVCSVEAMAPLALAWRVPRLLNGTHTRLKQVGMLRTPRLVIECPTDVALQLDGDIIVPAPPLRMTCECWPGAVQLVTKGP